MHDAEGRLVDEDRLYCALCLDAQKALGDQGHLSQVASFAATTSTGNMNLHLSSKHDIITSSEDKSNKIIGYLQKYADNDNSSSATASSTHELNRDILLWFCRDLISFDAVKKSGFVGFFGKNLPYITLPTPTTLGNMALDDV